jgi:hypothetical protein
MQATETAIMFETTGERPMTTLQTSRRTWVTVTPTADTLA